MSGMDVVGARVVGVARNELAVREAVSKALGQTDGGALFHVIPRDENGNVVARGAKDAAGEPVHGRIDWGMVDTRIGEAIKGLRAIGDDEPIHNHVGDLSSASQFAREAQALVAKGDDTTEQAKKVFILVRGVDSSNSGARANLRGDSTTEPRPRLTAHLARDESAAELERRMVPGTFTYDAHGDVVARQSYSDAAMTGRASRAANAELAAQAELDAFATPSVRQRARDRDASIQQMQAAQQ